MRRRSAMVSKLEKENLEAHVDLCAERYQKLEDRLDEMKQDFKEDRKVIHERIDKVKESIADLKQVIINSAIAIIVALVGGIFVLLTTGGM